MVHPRPSAFDGLARRGSGFGYEVRERVSPVALDLVGTATSVPLCDIVLDELGSNLARLVEQPLGSPTPAQVL